MIIASTHGLREVQPGEWYPLRIETMRKVRPFRLRVSPRCAPHFDIVDVTVGMRSQNPAAQSIPAARFSAEHDGGAWVIEEVDGAATPLTMILLNTSDAPMHFEGSWECSDEPHPAVTYLVHDTISTIAPVERREPSPTRAERKDPPGFGWDPFGDD